MIDIELRLEVPADYRETENVTREAFWNHHSPGSDSHFMVHVMRGCPAFLPELDFVAVHDGKIIGNVVYLKTVIKGDDGKDYEVLSLGPISVLPEYQRQGISGRLIGHTRKLARQMGFRAILLYGEPNYYTRQGFVAAEGLGIRTEDNMYAVALHVCELYENALAGITGRYIEDAIYNVDESALAEYDKSFPHKEIISGLPSQKRFDQIAAMRKPVQ